METSDVPNPLLSTTKHSDSQFHVQLHPLVILTISDYITRHVLRQQDGPIVGAIMGAQHGREITMEVAFECRLTGNEDGEVQLHSDWFDKRLQQFKEVHKSPSLDLVGWYTVGTPAGPQPYIRPIHQYLLDVYNDSALLLIFHPDSTNDGSAKGGKLPLSIYESVYEVATEDGDRQMQVPGEGPTLSIRFQEIPYSIETGEAEMIGVDSIASGGANAAVLPDDAKKPDAPEDKGKGKARTESSQGSATNGPTPLVLAPEDESLIQSLTAKANAIRMLQQRINLIKSYLQALPPCYLTEPAPQNADPLAVQTIPTDVEIPHAILRQTSSLLARLPLLTSTPTRQAESTLQAADVAMTTLLSTMGTAISGAQKMGHKAHVFETGRNAKERMNRGLEFSAEDARERGDHGLQSMSFSDGLTENGGGFVGNGKGGRVHGDEAVDLTDDRWMDVDE